MDRLDRPPPRVDARPSGLHPCYARYLRPFERVPDLSRAAFVADTPRHDRCARRVALQVATPQTVPAWTKTRRQARAGRPWKPTRRGAAGLPAIARGSDRRWRRRAGPD